MKNGANTDDTAAAAAILPPVLSNSLRVTPAATSANWSALLFSNFVSAIMGPCFEGYPQATSFLEFAPSHRQCPSNVCVNRARSRGITRLQQSYADVRGYPIQILVCNRLQPKI